MSRLLVLASTGPLVEGVVDPRCAGARGDPRAQPAVSGRTAPRRSARQGPAGLRAHPVAPVQIAGTAVAAPSSRRYPAAMATNVSARRKADAAAPLKDALKLVVWDLDETLWRGTLSEGEVELDRRTREIVRELNRRGIVNSICSKNDSAAARERLEQYGLWDEFVFPSIDWSPKGARDRAAHRGHAAARRPTCCSSTTTSATCRRRCTTSRACRSPTSVLGELLSLPQATGKDDRGADAPGAVSPARAQGRRPRRRHRLERGVPALVRHPRRARRGRRGEDAERLLELVNRSNQLNFTKSRLSEERAARAARGAGARDGLRARARPLRRLRRVRLLLAARRAH